MRWPFLIPSSCLEGWPCSDPPALIAPGCHEHSGLPSLQKNGASRRALSAEAGSPSSALGLGATGLCLCLGLLVLGQTGLVLVLLYPCHSPTSPVGKLWPRRDLHARLLICEAHVTRGEGPGRDQLDPERLALCLQYKQQLAQKPSLAQYGSDPCSQPYRP